MGYVRNTYGCHCFYGDSSFKRYNRAHLGGDVIFNFNSGNNITYNMGGGCGGNWFSSLMHGFGAGLGGYFGNMFGGFGMGMGNMFGGFGMGGFGFPMFGGGFGNWGLGGGTPAKSSASTAGTSKTKIKEDKDAKPIADLHTKVSDLVADIKSGKIKPGEVKTEVDKLLKEIEAKRGDGTSFKGDGIQDDVNGQNLDADIKTLKNLLGGVVVLGADGNSKDGITIIIGGKTINSENDLKDVPLDKLKEVSQDDARMILTKIGYINDDARSTKPEEEKGDSTNRLVGKFSSNPKILTLLMKSGVAVEVEYNKDAELDKWCSGPITDVEVNTDGTLKSFTLDCTKTGKEGFQNIYKVTPQADGKTFVPKKNGGNGNEVVNETTWSYNETQKLLIKTGTASVPRK